MKTLFILTCLVLSPALMAAGSDSDSSSSGGGYGSDPLDRFNLSAEMVKTKELISEENYKSAIRQLNEIVKNDWRNADAWNLMGYSQRKLGQYKKARKSYARALKYNPEHKGALEYQGELFITLKELDRAKANQRKLQELCPEGCEELTDLNNALSAVSG
ncbi:MAG: tetratricopeptide repeat protein [Gammaproteobacteria bacterium]|nr:tetratricopeptide repeat protein [Gammaproteobacteria bacterium]